MNHYFQWTSEIFTEMLAQLEEICSKTIFNPEHESSVKYSDKFKFGITGDNLIFKTEYDFCEFLADYFTGKARFTAKITQNNRVISPANYINKMSKLAVFKKVETVHDLQYNYDLLYGAKIRLCTEFSMIKTVQILESVFGHLVDAGKTEFTVLDPCAGWGNRAIGSQIFAKLRNCTIKYIGFDVNKKLVDGYKQISEIWPNCQFIMKPFEKQSAEILIELNNGNKFDFCMTSPPFYNLEIYSNDPEQSIISKTYKQWLFEFLFVMVKICSEVTDGYVEFYVSNFQKYKLFDDLSFYIYKELKPTQLFSLNYCRFPKNNGLPAIRFTNKV